MSSKHITDIFLWTPCPVVSEIYETLYVGLRLKVKYSWICSQYLHDRDTFKNRFLEKTRYFCCLIV